MDVDFRDSGSKAPLWERVSRKLADLGYNTSAKKCKEKFDNMYKYHRRTKQAATVSGKTYRFYKQLEAFETHSLVPVHDSTTLIQDAIPISIHKTDANFIASSSTSPASSSAKESKKRKLKQFFEKMMKSVVEKQENLHRKCIEVMEKCEHDSKLRHEVWRMQEMERVRRDRELLNHERSIAAAKDSAVLAFLHKFADQTTSTHLDENLVETSTERVEDGQANYNGADNVESFVHMISSCRLPKDELEALTRLRTDLEMQYEDNGPNGTLWEEISAAMKRVGYDRSAEWCKEKWENMNKSFGKAKESNGEGGDDSKTSLYFHQLDALYKEKTKKVASSVLEMRPEELLMHMMMGLGAHEQGRDQEPASESENANQIQQEDEDGRDGYQLGRNSVDTMSVMD